QAEVAGGAGALVRSAEDPPQAFHHGAPGVGRTVVDQDDLELAAEARRRVELVSDVEARNDDGNGGQHRASVLRDDLGREPRFGRNREEVLVTPPLRNMDLPKDGPAAV